MSYKCFNLPISLEMWDSIGLSLKDIDVYMGEETLLFGIFQISHGHILSALEIFNSKTITNNFSKTRDITRHLEKAESYIMNHLQTEGGIPSAEDLMTKIQECQVRVRMYDQYCIDDCIKRHFQTYKVEDESTIQEEEESSIGKSLAELRACFEGSDNEE